MKQAYHSHSKDGEIEAYNLLRDTACRGGVRICIELPSQLSSGPLCSVASWREVGQARRGLGSLRCIGQWLGGQSASQPKGDRVPCSGMKTQKG